MFLTAIAFLIGLSFLSSILVLAAVIRSGQVDQMADEYRRAALCADDGLAAQESGGNPDVIDVDVASESDWSSGAHVASYPFSLHEKA